MLFTCLSAILWKAWGDFRYNVYIFGGMLITLIAVFFVISFFQLSWAGL